MPTFKQDVYLGRDVALVKGDDISDDAISTEKIADGAVSTEKIADGAVTNGKLADGAVTNGKLADGSITAEKISEDAYEEMTSHVSIATEETVGTVKIGDGLNVKSDGTLSTEVKTIAIGELDSLCEDTVAGRKVTRDLRHSRYIVTATLGITYNAGILDVFSDSMGHVVTQVLTSHFTISDGALDPNSHADGTVLQYYRSYKVDGNLDINRGEWTEWQPLDNGLTKLLETTQEKLEQAIDDVDDKAERALSESENANNTAWSALKKANEAVTTAEAAETTAASAKTAATKAQLTAQDANVDAKEALSTANTAMTTANTAVTTANEAVSAANTATTTANKAVTAANTAATAANEAADKANAAIEKANTAIAEATDATTAANKAAVTAEKATTAATEATTNAQNAAFAATEAATKASTAATNATTAATEATNKANTAATAANNAATAANTAATNATTAANTAADKANAAATAANTAATKVDEAVANAEAAATKAETVAGNVNATLSDDNVLTITDASGQKKSLSLADAASVGDAVASAARASLALGHYSDRDDIVLTATETNKAISSDGVKVTKSGWAIAEFTAEKGNEYLFKPGVTDGSVCLFAEYIDKVEGRAIDYTYTYNTDGTIATATATYGGKTYTYTYTWATDTGGNTVATIKDASGNVVSSLPLLYTTTVGTYSPLVKLNADAELPTDGYCRFMSHFQGNSALKVVVSYKVGSADLTMKVLRDGVFASISTQLGNLSQKQSQTESEIAAMNQSYIDVKCVKEDGGHKVEVDGKQVVLELGVKTRLYPKTKFMTKEQYNRWYALLCHFNVSHLDVSGFTSMLNMFYGCSSLTSLDVSGWDTSKVTNMAGTFFGCSSLTSLDVSGWDVGNVTSMQDMFNGCSSLTSLDVSGWDTSKVTNMSFTFSTCSSLTSLDVSGWDVGNVTSMRDMFNKCSSLTSLDVSGWDTSKVTTFWWTFYGCSKLTTLDMTGWDMSSATSTNYTFGACSSLTTLIGSHTLAEVEAGTVTTMNGLKIGLDLGACTKLDRKSLLAVIKGLADLTGATSQTLALGSTLKAKLTSDDIAIATGKNWTIA